MNLLDNFTTSEPIFVDANIWTYFALNAESFQASCAAFLYRIEVGNISAVISNAILNEVFYAILVGKASAELGVTKIKQIHRHLRQDQALSAICYQTCLDFTQYVDKLLQTGLQNVSIDYQTQIASLQIGPQYGLLPTDALHTATCQRYRINHIATADAHFEQIPFLQVWRPEKST
jgi:predicted nucleic acid-binding protein